MWCSRSRGVRAVIRGVLGALLLAAPALQAAPALRIYATESGPISYQNGAHADGLVVDVAAAIQQRLGQREPIHIIPWARAAAIANDEANVLLLTLVRSPERERHMTFLGPIFHSTATVYAQRADLARLRALGPAVRQLPAGARRGSIFVDIGRRNGFAVSDQTDSSEAAARMLMRGRFPLWIDSDKVVAAALAAGGYRGTDVAPVMDLEISDVYFAFSAGTPAATVRQWEAMLRELKRDGSYRQIYHKWLPAEAAPMQTRRYGLVPAP